MEQHSLDRTEIYDVLSNERRLAILDLLREEPEWQLSDLAEEIAARETDERPPPRNKRQSVYVTLDQTHLPKLDDLDIVDYDAHRKAVSLRPDGLSLLPEDEDSSEATSNPDATSDDGTQWIDWCLSVAGMGLAASALTRLEVVPAGVAPTVFAEVTLLAIFVFMVYQKGRNQRP